MGSVVVAQELSCPEACGILVAGPGIKLVFPGLKVRFSTTGAPGKSQCLSNEFFLEDS